MEAVLNNQRNQYQITIQTDEVYDDVMIQRFIDYIKIKNILKKSKAEDEDIEDLSRQVKQSFWKENKIRLLDEDNS